MQVVPYERGNHPPVTRHEVAGVIITPDHKILLCQRSMTKRVAPGVWHIPDGTVDAGESDIETMHRELQEELGVKTVAMGDYTEVSFTYGLGDAIHQTRYYPVKIEGTIVLNPESDKYALVDLKDFETYLEPHTLAHHIEAVEKSFPASLFSDIA